MDLLCPYITGVDLQPFLVFRILEVLQSAFRAGHIQVADYTSFHVTLLLRFEVYPGTSINFSFMAVPFICQESLGTHLTLCSMLWIKICIVSSIGLAILWNLTTYFLFCSFYCAFCGYQHLDVIVSWKWNELVGFVFLLHVIFSFNGIILEFSYICCVTLLCRKSTSSHQVWWEVKWKDI